MVVTDRVEDQDSVVCSNEYSFMYSVSSQDKVGLALEYPIAASQGTPVQRGWQTGQGLSQGNRTGTVLLFPKEVLSLQLLPI